jgi:hypothetical protein
MNTDIERELFDREKRYWDAIRRRDRDTAMGLSDESCTVVGAQGVGEVDREQLGQMLEQANYELTDFAIDDNDFHVHAISDDVAVVSYRVREDLVVDGKPESLEAFDSSVWVRRDGQWLCCAHTESLKGDPYGRQHEAYSPIEGV